MTLTERIQTVLDDLKDEGVDQVSLAQAAGVTKGTVSQWLSGQIKSMKLEYAVGIQDRFGYSAVWLVMGKGPKMAGIKHSDDYNPLPLPPAKKIPVVAMAQLGDNGHFCELEYPAGHGDGYLQFFSSDPGAYGLRCVGDSMQPRIKDGEYVVVEPGHTVENGDEVLVKSHDGRVMVKTLAYKRDGHAHLLSINQSHATVKIPLEQIEHMHFVAAIVKATAWRPD